MPRPVAVSSGSYLTRTSFRLSHNTTTTVKWPEKRRTLNRIIATRAASIQIRRNHSCTILSRALLTRRDTENISQEH